MSEFSGKVKIGRDDLKDAVLQTPPTQTSGSFEAKPLNNLQNFFENGDYFDKSLGITPASDFALPTSNAQNEVEFTYQQSTGSPISSANEKLRNYSPFTMRVVPPLLYLDNPEALKGTQSSQVNMGIYDSAISNNSNFSNFTSIISSYSQSDSAISFSSANNPDFATTETMAVGGRSTTKMSPERQSDQMFESAITDFQVAEEMAIQLDIILQAPPITFYINPSSFSITYTKKHQFTERTRYGYIFQAWGEEQPKISVSGRIGSFVAGKGNSRQAVPTGHQFGSKLDSASFQQLMALLTLYKNNGYIYDNLGKSNAHHLVGCLALEYDHFTYFGHMDSFEWGYEEKDVAGGLSYSFNFVVSRMFDNSQSSLMVVKPQDSPVPVPTIPNLTDDINSGIPNSISTDNRFVSSNVEQQNTAQVNASTQNRNNLKSNQQPPQSVESSDIKVDAEEELEDLRELLPKNLIFNNSYGRG